MKMVVLSLLRMGDCLQHYILFTSYLQENHLHPKEVTWIIDESSKPFAKLLPENSKVLLFPRRQLQDILVLQKSSPIRSAQVLDEWCGHIGKADLLLNLTHTRLSYKLARFITAPKKVGFDLKNPYLQYMNNTAQSSELPMMPYFKLQSLALGMELNLGESRWPKKLKAISVHCLTSDKEKNWSFENWRILLRLLKLNYPDVEITAIGAPVEEELLKKEFAQLGTCYLFADLPTTRAHLQRTDLLLAMDSAMLHLAAWDNVPSLGIFCGPARAQKFSPISNSCEIVQHQNGSPPAPEEVFDILQRKLLDQSASTLNLKQMGKNWSLLREKLEYNKS